MPKEEDRFEMVEVGLVVDEEKISAEELALLEAHLPEVLKAVIALVDMEEE